MAEEKDVSELTSEEAVEAQNEADAETERQAREYQLAARGVEPAPTGFTVADDAYGQPEADDSDNDDKTAKEVVEEIKDADSVEEVKELAKDDDRKTVKQAAKKKVAAEKKAEKSDDDKS